MKKISFEEAIKALKEGKKVYNNPPQTYFKIDKGVLCRYSDIERQGEIVDYNSNIECNYQYYLPEEPKPFEITETGLYKSSDGRKIFLYQFSDVACFTVENDTSLTIYKCNRFGKPIVKYKQQFDIIGKWGDDE